MSSPRYWTTLAVASLVVGPLLMSVGDLLHPEERLDTADQAAIILDHPERWYGAHLLLFLGMLSFIPGLLAAAELLTQRANRSGFFARIFVLVGAAAFSAVFALEMVIGRFASDGADIAATTRLIETIQSGWMLGMILVGGIWFFVGVGLLAGNLIAANDGLRWPAALVALGVVLIIVEIASAQVIASQVGNVLVLVGSTWIAWRIASGAERLDVTP